MVTNSLSLQKKQWRCQRVKYPACSAPLPHPVALSLTGHQQTQHRCSLTSHKQPWQSALRWLPSVLTRSRETTVSCNVRLYGRRHSPVKQEILTENNNNTLWEQGFLLHFQMKCVISILCTECESSICMKYPDDLLTSSKMCNLSTLCAIVHPTMQCVHHDFPFLNNEATLMIFV